jgi:hypothetical protein
MRWCGKFDSRNHLAIGGITVSPLQRMNDTATMKRMHNVATNTGLISDTHGLLREEAPSALEGSDLTSSAEPYALNALAPAWRPCVEISP